MTTPENEVPDLKATSDEELYEWLKELTKHRHVKPHMFQNRAGVNTQLGDAHEEAEKEAKRRGWTWQYTHGDIHAVFCLTPPIRT